MRRTLSVVAILLALHGTASAASIQLDVFALGNSSSGGVGAAAGLLNAGDLLTISVNGDDLWSAGILPRWSNADGLTGPLFATGSDDSGQPAGTQIGANFGGHSQGGLLAPFGTLVGRIGGPAGSFFVVGTFFSENVPVGGLLELFYWDSNAGDNSEFVTATIRTPDSVPEPAVLALLALAGVAVVVRRKRA